MMVRTLLFSLLTILAGALGFMIGDTEPPLTRYYGRITPDNPLPGTEIQVKWDIRRNRDCPGLVYRRIVDSHGVVYDFAPVTSIYNTRDAGVVRTFKLPMQIAPGQAEYFAVNKMVCNPLQHLFPIVVDTPTVKFNVGDPKSTPGVPAD